MSVRFPPPPCQHRQRHTSRGLSVDGSARDLSRLSLVLAAGRRELATAAIDGAGPVRRFFDITFPLLSPTTFFLLVINIVYAMFETFGVIDATTEGGPARATNIMVYKVYFDGFVGQNIGSSAAQSVVLMLLVITLTIIQFRWVEKKVEY